MYVFKVNDIINGIRIDTQLTAHYFYATIEDIYMTLRDARAIHKSAIKQYTFYLV